MSSTTSTWRPRRFELRSLRIRTTPELEVPEPYEEIAIQSISQWMLSALDRSAITITAPLSTPTSSRSSPR